MKMCLLGFQLLSQKSHLDGEFKGQEMNTKNLKYQEMTRLEQSTELAAELFILPVVSVGSDI